jgi:flavin reductase (DIM6/NTAB) family NADH-FMN oxidoreductase RutF
MSDTSADSIFHLTNQDVYVITAFHEGQVSGQVATWVMLATLVPDHLRVIASLSPFNFTYELIQPSQRFVVNLLAEGQHDWVPRFGLYSSRDIDKFAGIELSYTRNGIPILPGTCGWAECQIQHHIETGDRVICIADVGAQKVYPEHRPLCKRQAFAALPAEVMQSLAEKRNQDIVRDRVVLKPFH